MVDNSPNFHPTPCFDPNTPNFSAIEPPATHFHHQNLHQINWNTHNLHPQFPIQNNDNNCSTTNPPPDLFNFFHFPPNCSSSICFSDPTRTGQITYDPVVLPIDDPPCFRELVKYLPNGSDWAGFGEMGMERGDRSRGFCDGDAVFGFNGRIGNGKRREKKDVRHFATEKQRRQLLNGKFEVLRSLIPNPTKYDRASIVGDAIEYINKLKRDLEELKILVDQKRFNRGRTKKLKIEDDSALDVASIYTSNDGSVAGGNTGSDQQVYNGSSTSTMKSSWLQRKSKNIEIDVQIVDDEVTIKLVQQKKMNCLLLVSKVVDEFQLDVHHVGGGLIGDFYSYLFNNKICEGSSVYASAIANKLIEVVDKEFATISLTSS